MEYCEQKLKDSLIAQWTCLIPLGGKFFNQFTAFTQKQDTSTTKCDYHTMDLHLTLKEPVQLFNTICGH